jgi:hypothetical protein
MRVGHLLLALSCGISLATAGAMSAHAAEARPWLCRDKPVFSSSSAMTYQVANRGDSRWELLLMQFAPGSAHDGYEIVASQELPAGTGKASGTLAAGRYFAVAMYRGGAGRWICPGYAEDKDRPAGVLSRICYGEEASSCPVSLSVVAAPSPGAAAR